MAKYNFTCKDCGHKFAVQMTFLERRNAACPKCGSKKLAGGLSIFSDSSSYFVGDGSGCGSLGGGG